MKITRKLKLSREVVRELDNSAMEAVRGGMPPVLTTGHLVCVPYSVGCNSASCKTC